MKSWLGIKSILWVAAGALAGYLAWWVLPGYFSAREDPRSVAHLSKIAADINRSVPVMIDKETELLPAEGREGMLIYNYRLVSYTASQLDPARFAAGVKQRVGREACSRPETRDDFLKQGVTLRYSYFDKNRKPITAVDITPADCGF